MGWRGSAAAPAGLSAIWTESISCLNPFGNSARSRTALRAVMEEGMELDFARKISLAIAAKGVVPRSRA